VGFEAGGKVKGELLGQHFQAVRVDHGGKLGEDRLHGETRLDGGGGGGGGHDGRGVRLRMVAP